MYSASIDCGSAWVELGMVCEGGLLAELSPNVIDDIVGNRERKVSVLFDYGKSDAFSEGPDKTHIDMVRVAANKKDRLSAIAYCRELSDLGYKDVDTVDELSKLLKC